MKKKVGRISSFSAVYSLRSPYIRCINTLNFRILYVNLIYCPFFSESNFQFLFNPPFLTVALVTSILKRRSRGQFTEPSLQFRDNIYFQSYFSYCYVESIRIRARQEENRFSQKVFTGTIKKRTDMEACVVGINCRRQRILLWSRRIQYVAIQVQLDAVVQTL